jgi:glycosyltransferase involved in cell wall biosynthesis
LKVSVIIPVYNAAPYLEKSVKSAVELPQVGEVLLIEDKSTDNSLDVCKQLQNTYEKVKFLQHEYGINRGAGESRNLGIRMAKNALIAFLDADDVYLPNRFDKSIEILHSNYDNADGVYEATEIWIEDNALKNDARFNLVQSDNGLITMREGIQSTELFQEMSVKSGGYFHLNALTVKKELALRVGLFENLELSQDIHFIYKLAFTGRLVGGQLIAPVAKYRLHYSNRAVANQDKVLELRARMWLKLLDWLNRQDKSRQEQAYILSRFILDSWRRRKYIGFYQLTMIMTKTLSNNFKIMPLMLEIIKIRLFKL